MEQKTAYEVRSNTDLTEGRGHEYAKFICELQTTAERLGRRGYVQGTDCTVYPVELFLHEGRWYGPIHVEGPSESDRKLDAERQAEEQRRIARIAVLNKARELGLSEEDIAILRG